MKKAIPILVTVAILVLLVVGALPDSASAHGWRGHHGHRSHVVIGVGPYWWGPRPWYYPPPYYVYTPPPVIVQEPPVYIQQTPPQVSSTTAAGPSAESYWYYCQSAAGYYPTVPTCAESWVKVPPRP